jgi:hypothetical protein
MTEFDECAKDFHERTNCHLQSLHAKEGQQCGAYGPWSFWLVPDGPGKPCVRRVGHRGMHYDGVGWWSDEQAAEEVERIAQEIHDS